jgi:hypothetical protein
MKRQLIVSLAGLMACVTAMAQSGTNSPYSQFGIGVLADGATGFNKAMGGVGTAVRQSGYVNTLNPASYSSIDSLTFIFDIGLSGQVTNFKEGNTRVNARSADFEYAIGSFRVAKHTGMSFGILPYSNIGYNYKAYSTVNNNPTEQAASTITETYTGEGGLHKAFVGIGWEPFTNLSIGANVSYLWGSYKRAVTNSSTTYINSIGKTYEGSVNSFALDFGAQYTLPIKKDKLTFGATVGVGHKLGTDPTCTITNTNSTTSKAVDSVFTAPNALAIPMTYSFGVAWQRGTQWLVSADLELQQWSKLTFPYYNQQIGAYENRSDMLNNMTKLRLGLEWTPNDRDTRSYLKRVHYRIGAMYNTSYVKVNGQNGPKEYGITAGFGLPIQNVWGGRSSVNISGAWVHSAASGLITENTFRINLGITFNERWFQKWKVQ